MRGGGLNARGGICLFILAHNEQLTRTKVHEKRKMKKKNEKRKKILENRVLFGVRENEQTNTPPRIRNFADFFARCFFGTTSFFRFIAGNLTIFLKRSAEVLLN